MKKCFLSLSVFFVSFLITGCLIEKNEDHAVITFMIGDVKKNNGEAEIGEIIKENDNITTGVNSFCDIKIGESMIRIKSKSDVNIAGLIKSNTIENTIINLDSGKMICKAKKLLKDESFVVKTPTTVAAIRGTQFIVETDKALTTRIKVFEGEVKVAKRVKQLETSLDKVLDYAPTVKQQEKVIITANEVQWAEKIVDASLKKKAGSTTPSDEVIDRVINDRKDAIAVKKASIVKFNASDFADENKELIEIENKPKDVIARINSIILQEKDHPIPEGRLLITKYDMYFIKDGKVQWGGKIINGPVKDGNKLYVATGDYLYCAQEDGPVLWKIQIKNYNKITIMDGKLKITSSGGKSIYIDPNTGKRI
ncbi:MAG: FecR domain-containing protein [Leptospirales bacterium]|nr:FecR domain-containing protein [Leptospirales bacterium]